MALMTRLPRLLLWLLVLAAAAAIGLRHLYDLALQPATSTEERRFSVPAGAGLRTTLDQLHAEGLLAHPRLFEVWLRIHRARYGRALPTVRKGRYRVPAGAEPRWILEQMEQGRVILEQYTIVEGWTFAQARAGLASLAAVEPTLRDQDDAAVMATLGKADVPAEGRIAPDTYRFAEGSTDREILQIALAAQARTLEQAWASRDPGLPLRSADEVLVLASIVEKETGLAEERPRIAGVFLNRLRKGMRLQSDPTVIYGLGGRYDGDIRARDLHEDTPWNTYTRPGLPPTPIALPGKDAINAVTHPEATDALYFVALGDGSGGHRFSATLEEHNRAVKRYLRQSKAKGARP